MSIFGVHRGTARLSVPVSQLVVVGGASSMVRDAAGQFTLRLTAAGTTYNLGLPLSHHVFRVTSATSPNIFGFRLEEVLLWYSIVSVNLSAHDFSLYGESMAGGSARGTGNVFDSMTVANGKLTVLNHDGTTSLPTATSANTYLTRIKLSTPLQLVKDNSQYMADWQMGTGATSGAFYIHGVQLKGSVGIYV